MGAKAKARIPRKVREGVTTTVTALVAIQDETRIPTLGPKEAKKVKAAARVVGRARGEKERTSRRLRSRTSTVLWRTTSATNRRRLRIRRAAKAKRMKRLWTMSSTNIWAQARTTAARQSPLEY